MIRLQLFGRASLVSDHGAISLFPSRRCTSLFCLLSLHAGKWVSRSRLQESLWPGRHDPGVGHCLDTELWRLRRTLHPLRLSDGGSSSLLSSSRGHVGLCIGQDFCNDVHEFERYHRKLRRLDMHWPTEIIPNCTELDHFSREFAAGIQDDWCWMERERLRGALTEILAVLLATAEYKALWQDVLDYGHRLLTQEPLLESVHRSMLRAHFALGNYDAALRQFRGFSRRLQRELHATPAPQTLQLIRSVIQGGGAPMAGLPRGSTADTRVTPETRDASTPEQLIEQALRHVATAEELLEAARLQKTLP